MRKTVVIIPSRLDSKRLPGKALLDIDGKPLIVNVYDSAKGIYPTYVASYSDEIHDICKEYSIPCIRTHREQQCNGTENCWEAANVLGMNNGDYVINIQGDKLVNSHIISHLRSMMTPSYHTLFCLYEKEGNNRVRVVVDKEDNAHYFTRSEIPHPFHCGVYGYTVAFLNRYKAWGQGKWEKHEGLEQMRVLENGCYIKCFQTENSGHSINLEADILSIA